MSDGPPQELDWPRLTAIARQEVANLIQSLPEPLRLQASALPVTCEHVPNAQLILEGIEPDTLGLFVGPSYADEPAATPPIPAQVILFLDNLWDMAEGDEAVFREELRITFMHELGHYLGLDEDDMFDRGLE